MTTLRCGTRRLALDRPRVMGILNVTPDSFSDGGLFLARDAALEQAGRLLYEGADLLDIGGESTRPGASAVGEQEELDRVVPVIEAIVARFDTIVSVDTSKAVVMREAIAAGAGMVNDVRALREPGALDAVAATGAAVVLMHMQGEPRTMQAAPHYDDVELEVRRFLEERLAAARAASIGSDRLAIDPGFGFGKTLAHNCRLLQSLGGLTAVAPVVAGVSRKRMIGALLGDEHTDRRLGSTVASLLAVQRGASVVRVHDVRPMVEALAIDQGVSSHAGRALRPLATTADTIGSAH